MPAAPRHRLAVVIGRVAQAPPYEVDRAGLHRGAGQVAVISSPRPDSPSQHTNSTSSRPRFRSCASACAHAFAPSAGATQIPSTRLAPVVVDPDRDVHRLVPHRRPVPHLRDQRVDVDHRVERLQRPVLPLPHALQRPVRHPRDRVVRQVHPRRLPHVPGDVPHDMPLA